jgi:hypothetical protein
VKGLGNLILLDVQRLGVPELALHGLNSFDGKEQTSSFASMVGLEFSILHLIPLLRFPKFEAVTAFDRVEALEHRLPAHSRTMHTYYGHLMPLLGLQGGDESAATM